MFQPESYAIALAFMVLSMLCWGSWANTVKLCPGFRFQLFYWDYAAGLLIAAVIWGFTMGSAGSTGLPFAADLLHSDSGHLLLALAGGALFNVANLLLVAAIEIAGLAVAFPVGIGIALVVGAATSYAVSPNGNPALLFGGIVLVLVAIVLDALAYRLREGQSQAASRRGIILSVIAGILMGLFYPLVAASMTGAGAPGPYAVMLFFAFGVVLCSIPLNFLLMRKPLDGREPVAMRGYWKAPVKWHGWGLLGGAIWSSGAVLNFVASQTHVVGPAVSYSIGQGATMVSALWGVFVWREFAGAPHLSKKLLVWMFVFFIVGLTTVAMAPIF